MDATSIQPQAVMPLDEAARHWLDSEAELPLDSEMFLRLCAAHKVRIPGAAEAFLREYVQQIWACGPRHGMQCRADKELPAKQPDVLRYAHSLTQALVAAHLQLPLRLRVCMVPKPLHGYNLRRVLTRAAWSALRLELLDERGPSCEFCGTPSSDPSQLDAHEQWTYNPDSRPATATVTGIRLACTKCHAVVHLGLQVGLVQSGKLPGEHLVQLQEHFCRVNGVSLKTYELHINAEYTRWQALSKRRRWNVNFGPYQHLVPPEAAA